MRYLTHLLARSTAPAVIALAVAMPALAQVKVQDAWVRGMVPGQDTTGAYMKLDSTTDGALVGARSPAAKSVELHSMRMENGVMKMRALPRVPLAKGKSLEFSPSGMHLMLTGVGHPLREGERVTITLLVEDANGKRSEIDVSAPVRPLEASGHTGHSH